MECVLECRNVSKFYGGLSAVEDLSFCVGKGVIFGIAGPNGAGKTTLFDVITGLTNISSGEIYFLGEPIHTRRSYQIFRMGLSRTFQIPVVFQSQSVLMNVFVGAQFGKHRRALFSVFNFDEEIIRQARDALEFVGLGDKVDELSNDISLFDKKRLMLASALAIDPILLLLDEPVGGLNTAEIEEFMSLILKIREKGITIIIIEHVMKALMGLSDYVLFMHYGRKIFDGLPNEAIENPEVLKVYLGDQFSLNNQETLKREME